MNTTPRRQPRQVAGQPLAPLVQQLRSELMTVQAAIREGYALTALLEDALASGAHNLTAQEAAEVAVLAAGARAYLDNDEDGMNSMGEDMPS